MQLKPIRNIIPDRYGFKWLHTIRAYKNKKIVSETVSLNNKPLYKMVLNGNKFTEYDMGLFGKWIERK